MENIIVFFERYIWQVITTIISLTSLWLLWSNSQRKSLSYEVISNINILDIPEEFKDKLEISFDSKPVQELYVTLIKIINTGKAPITPKDFHRPISIGFGETATVLTFELINQTPSNLNPDIRNIQSNSVKYQILVEPSLLNKSDSFTIKMLVTKFEEIKVEGRIAGIQNITELSKDIRFKLMFSLATNLIYIFNSAMVIGFSILIGNLGNFLINHAKLKEVEVLIDISNALLIIGIPTIVLAAINIIPVLKAFFKKPKSYN